MPAIGHFQFNALSLTRKWQAVACDVFLVGLVKDNFLSRAFLYRCAFAVRRADRSLGKMELRFAQIALCTGILQMRIVIP